MKKTRILLSLLLLLFLLVGCGAKTAAGPADGAYEIGVTLSGGSGKASVASPAILTVKDGEMTARIVWSSANYDYMLVDGARLDAQILDGHSVFEIPVAALDQEQKVIADTVAMSTPHEIEYTLRFDSSTLKAAEP